MRDTEVREKVLDILREIHSDIDFEQETKLVDDGVLYSFDLVALAAELGEEFDIEITGKEFVASNFNSVDGITRMILKLKGD